MEAFRFSKMELDQSVQAPHRMDPGPLITFRPATFEFNSERAEELRLTAAADKSSGIVRDADHLSARRDIDDDVALRSDGSICLGVKNHDSSHALFGAARYPLSKIRSTGLRAIKLNREFRV